MTALAPLRRPGTGPGDAGPVGALVVLEAPLAVGAAFGAVGLVTGGIDLGGAVDDLPFASPVLAGLSLAVVNGLLPAVVAGGAVRRRPWARAGHVAVGAALMAWIVVQVAVIGLGSWLQVGYFAYGAVIVVMGAAALRRDRGTGTARTGGEVPPVR